MSRCEISVNTGLPSTELTLLDHNGAIVATSTGSLKQGGLDPGLYRLQVEAGPNTTEQLVTLRPGTKAERYVHVALPLVTPVTGASTNQHHTGPASQLSVEPTASPGKGSRLVLFVRNPDEETVSRKLHLTGVDLFDVHRRSVLPRAGDWLSGVGFAGVSLELEPGSYLLATGRGASRVEQSLVTVRGWTTLAFIPAQPDERGQWRPVPRSMVVQMVSIDRRFEPYDFGSDAAFAAEMALDGLRAGQVSMPERGWAMLQRGELRKNPMLGVYLGHAMLAERRFSMAKVRRLVRDLRAVLQDHPDVDALYCKLKDLTRDMSRTRMTPRSVPPMLGVSYQALIARDAAEPPLLVDGSLAEEASTRQRQDSVWARWDSPSTGLDVVTVNSSFVDDAAELAAGLVDTTQVRGRSAPEGFDKRAKVSRVDSGDHEVVPREVAELAGAIRQLALHRDEGASDLTVGDLSRHVGLPVSKVRANLQAISDASSLDLY